MYLVVELSIFRQYFTVRLEVTAMCLYADFQEKCAVDHENTVSIHSLFLRPSLHLFIQKFLFSALYSLSLSLPISPWQSI